jgi:hypothetical protein
VKALHEKTNTYGKKERGDTAAVSGGLDHCKKFTARTGSQLQMLPSALQVKTWALKDHPHPGDSSYRAEGEWNCYPSVVSYLRLRAEPVTGTRNERFLVAK